MEKNGFTLIELMITVAIIAIIAAIAYPSYQDSVIKSRRGEAQAEMLNIAQRQQQYLLDMREYANSLATLSVTVPAHVTAHYDISVNATQGPPPTFMITATPKAGSPQVKDGDLTLSHQGVKTPATKW